MEFMKGLRDQTAADGVCLAAMLAFFYPVGQYIWYFLSHQVSNCNLCHPAARCLSTFVCSAREDRESRRNTEHGDKHGVSTEAEAVIISSFILSLLVFATCACNVKAWRGSFKVTTCGCTEGSA